MTSIPVTELKNADATVTLCQQSEEPVLVTKNGHPTLWLVNPEEMERLRKADERGRLLQAVMHSEQQWHDGLATSVSAGIDEMRSGYSL